MQTAPHKNHILFVLPHVIAAKTHTEMILISNIVLILYCIVFAARTEP